MAALLPLAGGGSDKGLSEGGEELAPGKAMELRQMLVTASPKLCASIKMYYQSLKAVLDPPGAQASKGGEQEAAPSGEGATEVMMDVP